MTGSIDDWFADRQSGMLDDSSEDEVVEASAPWNSPAEDSEAPRGARSVPLERELNALQRRNGLPGREQPPAHTSSR